MASFEAFREISLEPHVEGYLHRTVHPSGNGLVLTHGAGANCASPLLTALAAAFADAGITVLRCNLPFRQVRSYGPPRPGDAERDREGLNHAVAALRKLVPGRIYLGGQSYGGRQATMLCAENLTLADGLLLLSYPLHPPGKPEQLRTQHLPKLHVPSLFVHGTCDPFGTIPEVEAALKLIPGKVLLLSAKGAGHDLGFKGKSKREDVIESVVNAFHPFFDTL
jgi:predicted alpha/beta-hydrolase family hydrolase